MALSIRNPVTTREFITLHEKIRTNEYQTHHCRNGTGLEVKYYCAVWINPKHTNVLFGHIVGPEKNNAKFSVQIEDGEVVIGISPDHDCEALTSSLEKEIQGALRKIFRKSIANPPEIVSTKGWRGYYLFRSKRDISTKQKEVLNQAAESQVINKSFAETCVRIKMRMGYYAS